MLELLKAGVLLASGTSLSLSPAGLGEFMADIDFFHDRIISLRKSRTIHSSSAAWAASP